MQMFNNGISEKMLDNSVKTIKNYSGKLPADFKAKWIEDLRSGQYHQMQNYLHESDTSNYCCLGLVCKIRNIPEVGICEGKVIYGYKYMQDETSDKSLLPYGVGEEIGISRVLSAAFINLNDSGQYSFAQIADLIEEYL